jgi:hypothetical protein
MPNNFEGPDGRLGQLSPFGRIGSVVNVAICAVVVVGALIVTFTTSPIALVIAAVAAWMGVRFVRVLRLVYKGFYDPPQEG